MKRTFFGCFCALCIGFVSGCGGGSTETTVIEEVPVQTEEEIEDYEAEMDAVVPTDG